MPLAHLKASTEPILIGGRRCRHPSVLLPATGLEEQLMDKPGGIPHDAAHEVFKVGLGIDTRLH